MLSEATFAAPRARSNRSQRFSEVLRSSIAWEFTTTFSISAAIRFAAFRSSPGAGAAGWRFTPKQLFQNQTIAELGQIAESAATIYATRAGDGARTFTTHPTRMPGTRIGCPSHHNQAVMLTVTGGVRPETIDRALRMLLVHHDALRMRYKRTTDEGWTQAIAPPEDRPVLTCVDLSVTSDEEATQAIESIATTTQGTLDLKVGPLLRCVYFDLGPERSARLLLVIHHLVVERSKLANLALRLEFSLSTDRGRRICGASP